MHYHQKGTIVKLTERPPKTPRTETVVAIRGVPRGPRSGARCIVVAVSIVASVLLRLSLGAAPALAAQPPEIRSFVVEQVRATRAIATTPSGSIDSNGIPTTEARVELAPSPSGPWTVKGRKTRSKFEEEGVSPEIASIEVRLEHLKPEFTYYARAFAANSAGSTTTAPVEFTTHAPEAPEIGRLAVPEIEGLSGEGVELGATYAAFQTAGIETNGADTAYDFEYSLPESGHVPAENSLSWAPFTSGASGTVTAAEDTANPGAKLTGLAPATKYYMRLKVTNAVGSVVATEPFETKPSAPEAGARAVQVSDLTGTSASINASFHTRGYETHWRLQYSSTGAGGPWTTGAEGTVVAVAASELFASEQLFYADVTITGLSPSTTYYTRIVLDNGNPPEAISQPVSFQTVGPPSELRTFAVHTLDGESMRVLGAFDPHAVRVQERQAVTLGGSPSGGSFTLGFDGETTVPIAFNARPAAVKSALGALGSLEGNPTAKVSVYGNPGGPYTIVFGGSLAGADQPQITADASGLTPSGTIAVATAQTGLSYDAHYHFEYVSQQQFEAEGFAGAASAPEVDLGADESTTQFVGEDLPGLQPATAYHFRLAAKNSAIPGEPLVYGPEQTLTAPSLPWGGGEEACPNQAFRMGPSANLPDCRAYELVTPPEKGGTLDFDTYGQGQPSYLAGEDGEHVWLYSTGTQFGSNADPRTSSYFFARNATGWGLTSATVQPQAGIYSKSISVFNSDLTQVALQTGWATVPGEAGSPDVTFEAGPPGGPYVPVISIPSRYESAWAAASGDFAKLILQTQDYELLGEPTGTKQGNDLYEYAEGQLRQVNVDSEGTKLGVCGARLALGTEGAATSSSQSVASPHAVSADGARVFFNAVPGSSCGAAAHLYMRSNGAETLDIGPYAYLAANPQGSKLLLKKPNGAGREIFLYDTETQELKLLFSTPDDQHPGGGEDQIVRSSADLSTVYFSSAAQLTPEAPPGGGTYRYEAATEKLRFLLPSVGTAFVSPDGRYLYYRGAAPPGVPGGVASQVYRYDSVENVIQCMSCASPFDPEPKLVAVFKNEIATDGVPDTTAASANGDYVFFETPSALVPQDVDGEIKPTVFGNEPDQLRSRSSDVYEWRKPGVDGCVHVQGCLALISGGKGGYKTEIVGIAHEGRDVFFATHEALVAQDRDGAGDIYDARIGGGFALPPPRPVECEGDACSTPASPPLDATPSSFAFSGPGNSVASSPSVASQPKAKPKKAKPKKRHKRHRRKKEKGRRSTASKPGHGKGGKS